MSEFPVIHTAIPQRRYRVGEFDVSLLGDIESGDGIDYRYILAFVEEGKGKPGFFVCSERNPPGERSEGSHRLRMINEVFSDVISSDDAWKDMDRFAEEGLQIGIKALSLKDETPVRLI